jgi:3-methyladenine DNA glycosylase AlkD
MVSAASELKNLANPSRAFDHQRFFKTAKGQYGEGDIFLGITVPQVRKIATKHKKISFKEIEVLTASKYHELRLCGLIILTLQFKETKDRSVRKSIFNFYLKQAKAGRINNWDLVDVTAPIIGAYLVDENNPYPLLEKLSRSKTLWDRRLAIIFTFAFIRAGELDPTIEISQKLLRDEHDLIHKAVGWMLREVGKRDVRVLRDFLRDYSHKMPRTALRYAIEKLPEPERKKWLADSR